MKNENLSWKLTAAFVITFVFMAPIVWMILAAFKTINDIYAIPPVWIPDFSYLDNFKLLLSENWKFLMNSTIVTLFATLLCLAFALPAAFALVYFKFQKQNFIADWILSTRMMPPIAAAVPLYMVFNGVGMLDTLPALILVYAGFNLPFAVWVAMSFFRNIPKEIIEAARVEGCSWVQTFRIIALPLAKSGIATVATFVFIFAWNELLLSLFLTTREAKTFPVVISSFSTVTKTYWELISAATIIQILPPVIFTILMQKHIVSGLTMGAVKN
ncbi:carbohydrate ABC transporter permease [Pararhizobium sp. IMCC21322]|uniref:carbohydrate ABC transporter permease n=1 Tax=Pararhizobium sp. IMCC21322 TaxID=3067903 RepID=UPI002740AFE0|nr:carbohydrate ABC transporter permease [Pararhizobium sp. IMCC21322]